MNRSIKNILSEGAVSQGIRYLKRHRPPNSLPNTEIGRASLVHHVLEFRNEIVLVVIAADS